MGTHGGDTRRGGSAAHRGEAEQSAVFLVGVVVDRLAGRADAFAPGHEHRAAFARSRGAPDAVTVADLQSPGQARSLHRARAAERDRTFGRFVWRREERLRIDRAA